MENPEKKRIPTPGHEHHGVHACHKCGWPFPNPHPSAKHRRAHKRICGTVEGYKVVDPEGSNLSNVLDDERHSDEDHKQPLTMSDPKVIEMGGEMKASGRIHEGVIRSEEEVFSDAADDFSNSGFSLGNEEHSRDITGSASNFERVVKNDLSICESSEDKGIGGNDLVTSGSGVFDEVQSKHTDTKGNHEIELDKDKVNVVDSSREVVGENFHRSSKIEAMDVVTLDHEVDNGTVQLDGSNSKKNGKAELDGHLVDVASFTEVPGERLEVASGLEASHIVISDSELSDGVIELKKEGSGEFHAKLSQRELPDRELVQHENASVNSSQVDSTPVIDFVNSNVSAEDLPENKGENENVHVLTVPDDIPYVAHPEIMNNGFEEHIGVKQQIDSNPESSETSCLKEDYTNDLASEQPEKLREVIKVSATDLKVLVDSIKDELAIREPVGIKDLPVEEHGVPSFEHATDDNLRLDQIGSSERAARAEMNDNHIVHINGGKKSDDVCEDSFEANLPKDNTISSDQIVPLDSLVSSETTGKTDNIGLDGFSQDEKAAMQRDATDIDDSHQGPLELSVVKEGTAIVKHIVSPTEIQVKPSVSVLDGSLGSDLEKCNIGESDVAECQSTEGLMEKNVLEESVGCRNTQHAEFGTVSGTHSCMKEDKFNNENKEDMEYTRKFNTAEDLNHGEFGRLQSTPEDINVKDPGISDLDTNHSVKTIPIFEGNNARESVQSQGDSNMVNKQLGTPGGDVSVDSSGRSESLEGNWGSVSVLSLQSDVPAAVDSETLASVDSQASMRAVKSSLIMPKASPEAQHSEKSEMFEPPSFMTLVEPGSAGQQKSSASEIWRVQNQQSNSASLQAGWFPSLAQVINVSQGRKKNEEIIEKVTKWNTGTQHAPLKNLLGEAAYDSKPRSPKSRENLSFANQKNGRMSKDVGSQMKIAASIMCPESPAAKSAKEDIGKEWNSPARYPSEISREKRKVKSRPYWVSFVCCSSVNTR